MENSCFGSSLHWKSFMHTSFFKCHTFSASDNNIYSGAENGLSLIVAMENKMPGSILVHSVANRYSNVENSFGVRIIIHERGTLANPDNSGIDIIPGTSTSIGLHMTSIKKLQNPHGECIDKKHLPGSNQYKYTSQGCTDMCLSRYVAEQCRCLNDFRPVPATYSHLRSCYYFDNLTVSFQQFNESYFCMKHKQLNFIRNANGREKCHCFEACSYPLYDVTTSQNVWPTHDYVISIYEHLIAESLKYRNATPLFTTFLNDIYEDAYNTTNETVQEYFADHMKANFARINVYFESLTVLERKQEASMTIADLFANIGGTIGLWAGLSIITVIEFGFFLFNLATIKCKRKNKVEPEK